MAAYVDYALAFIAIVSCWYGLAAGTRFRGIFAVAAGLSAAAGLLLSLSGGFIAAMTLVLVLLVLVGVVLLTLAQPGPHRLRRPTLRRRIVAAASGASVFALLSSGILASEFPVPVWWMPEDAVSLLGRELLTRSGFLLHALGLAFLTALVGMVWVMSSRRRPEQREQTDQAERQAPQAVPHYRSEHHKHGGS